MAQPQRVLDFDYFERRSLSASMLIDHALDALSALSNGARLVIFRTLVNHEPEGLTAGVLTDMMGMRHNTLSNHLAVLSRGGLICGTREGRFVRYRACLDGMHGLLAFLLDDCCGGRSELCLQPHPTDPACDCVAEVPAPPRPLPRPGGRRSGQWRGQGRGPACRRTGG